MDSHLNIEHSSHEENSGLQVFNFSSLISELKAGHDWENLDRAVSTLIKTPGLQIVLIAMHSNTTKSWHKVECPISLQLIQGSVDFITDSQTVALKEGDILTLKEGIRHHMHVKEEAVALLSLGTSLGKASNSASKPIAY